MKQLYNQYTAEDRKVWEILFNKQESLLNKVASKAYLKGKSAIGFRKEEIPRFSHMNDVLSKMTGWTLVVVPGLIDNRTFFQYLENKKFPATCWFRTLAKIDYLQEPDMFHDVYAHVPLLSDKHFCGFLSGLASISLQHIDNEYIIEIISRLYWFTVEFGLIQEDGDLKIYGAGILSSNGESKYCTNVKREHIPYSPSVVVEYPYIKERFQDQYFVIESYKELHDSLSEIQELLNKKATA